MRNCLAARIGFGCSRYADIATRVEPRIGTRWKYGVGSARHQLWALRLERVRCKGGRSGAQSDSVLLPGHVSPYVLPGAFAVGETGHRSGKDMIAAVAVSHEMSYRFGAPRTERASTGTARQQQQHPPVVGYSSTIFGATAPAAMLKGADRRPHRERHRARGDHHASQRATIKVPD